VRYYADVDGLPAEDTEDAKQAAPFRGLAFTLSSLGYTISQRFKQTLAPFDLEPREFALLRSVAYDEGQSQQTLGDRLQIPRSRMVAIVDELEQRGHLERRASPDDRRVRLLHLTDTGRQLLQQAFAQALTYERQISAPLSPQEREHLLDLLERVATPMGLTTGGAHPALREPTENSDHCTTH
jgi:DNA-binding MarR family transcriptional regulator